MSKITRLKKRRKAHEKKVLDQALATLVYGAIDQETWRKKCPNTACCPACIRNKDYIPALYLTASDIQHGLRKGSTTIWSCTNCGLVFGAHFFTDVEPVNWMGYSIYEKREGKYVQVAGLPDPRQ